MKKNERIALEEALRKTVGQTPRGEDDDPPRAGLSREKIETIAKQIANDPAFKDG